jgi:hypothetical protein
MFQALTVMKLKRWKGYVVRILDKRIACRFLVEKPERKRPLGIHRCWFEEILKWILQK